MLFDDHSVLPRSDTSFTGYDTVQTFSVDRALSLFRVEVSTAGDNENVSFYCIP
jgi:hypothetical protein